MFLDPFIKSLLPEFYSFPEQVIALTVINTSLLLSLAMLFLILYWVATRSFESIKTAFAVLCVILFLSIGIGLEILGQVAAGAWLLVIIMLVLNLANMLGYGISTSASAGYILAILLAMFCISPAAGYAVTFLGCALVFTIPILQSKGRLKTVLPYLPSAITFDAPILMLLYLLTAAMTGGWVNSIYTVLTK